MRTTTDLSPTGKRKRENPIRKRKSTLVRKTINPRVVKVGYSNELIQSIKSTQRKLKGYLSRIKRERITKAFDQEVKRFRERWNIVPKNPKDPKFPFLELIKQESANHDLLAQITMRERGIEIEEARSRVKRKYLGEIHSLLDRFGLPLGFKDYVRLCLNFTGISDDEISWSSLEAFPGGQGVSETWIGHINGFENDDILRETRNLLLLMKRAQGRLPHLGEERDRGKESLIRQIYKEFPDFTQRKRYHIYNDRTSGREDLQLYEEGYVKIENRVKKEEIEK